MRRFLLTRLERFLRGPLDPYSAGHDAMLEWNEREKAAYRRWVRNL